MKALRPYLYHAYYNWIVDNEYTPYLLVNTAYPDVNVPMEYINEEGKIVLNVAPISIGNYVVNDDYVSFSARFNGVVRDLFLPFGSVEAIYSRETGDGVMFQAEEYYSESSYQARNAQAVEKAVKTPKKKGHLKLVK